MSDCRSLFELDTLRRANISIHVVDMYNPTYLKESSAAEDMRTFEKDIGDAVAPLDDQLEKTPM